MLVVVVVVMPMPMTSLPLPPCRTQTMGLLSSFLDKHYPHEEMVKQRKKQKGISASTSGELLPLKSILEVLLNKAMRPDAYVTVDDQVMMMMMMLLMTMMMMMMMMITLFICVRVSVCVSVYFCTCVCVGLTLVAVVGRLC